MRNRPTGRRAAAASSGWSVWRRGPSVPVLALQARPNVSQSVSAIAALRCAAGAAESRMRLGPCWAEIDRAAFCGDPFRWIGYGTQRFSLFGAEIARMRTAQDPRARCSSHDPNLCFARRTRSEPPTLSTDAREACWATWTDEQLQQRLDTAANCHAGPHPRAQMA